MDSLKYKLLQFFKWKLDGAPMYIGKGMYETHKDLGITDEVFDSTSSVFTYQLRRIRPRMNVFREFVQRVSDMRNDIVIPLPPGVKGPFDACPVSFDKGKKFEEADQEEVDIFNSLGEE